MRDQLRLMAARLAARDQAVVQHIQVDAARAPNGPPARRAAPRARRLSPPAARTRSL
jgi:hypothetical protein